MCVCVCVCVLQCVCVYVCSDDPMKCYRYVKRSAEDTTYRMLFCRVLLGDIKVSDRVGGGAIEWGCVHTPACTHALHVL